MKMIAAAAKDGGIGKNGKLLVNLPSDMKYFRQQTLGKTVVMGRATLESFPGGKPLPKRRNIILSTKLALGDGYEVCRDEEELLALLSDEDPENIMVIGGGQVYKLLLPHCTEALITEVDGTFEADTYIPIFSESPDWEIAKKSDIIEENGVSFRFVVYKRKPETGRCR